MDTIGEAVYRELVHMLAALRRPTFSIDLNSPDSRRCNHDGLKPCAIYLDRGSMNHLIAYDTGVVFRSLERNHAGDWKFQNIPTFRVESAVTHIKVYGERQE